MAKVKIKIEVNPNADDEELGNIQNQVNNTPSLENVSNVSVKIRGDGIYEEIPSNSGGINGLSLGYALVFDENGYLDNADLEGGVLESTENPVEFVWGVIPENGEYTVRLTFTDAQSLKDITIFGDSEVNQFPTRAIIDGYKEITNDDLTWYINFGNEASTHTIEFTHWNRVNYNACLSKIGITLQYIEIDKTSGLKSVDSTSQSSADTTGVFYGSVENRGSLEILDKTGELVDMLKDGIIDNSNTKLEIVANNKTIQTHISTDSTYNANSQVMSLDLGNRLSSLDILKYKGYNYPDHSERLSVLFFDVLSNLRYALFGKDKELTEEEFKEMLSAKYDGVKTLYDYLYSIEIEYPFIEANKTYREVIDEFCLIAQMQMFIDDENNIQFVSARPKQFDVDLNSIHIMPKNMFSQLDYSVIVKNKYDGVEISKSDVVVKNEYNIPVFTSEKITFENFSMSLDLPTIPELNSRISSTIVNNDGTGVYVFINNYYYETSVEIPIKQNSNLEQITSIMQSLTTFDESGNIVPRYNLKCYKHTEAPDFPILFSFKGTEIVAIEGTDEVGDIIFNYPPEEVSRIKPTYFIEGVGEVGIDPSHRSEKIAIEKDDKTNKYYINIRILIGQKLIVSDVGLAEKAKIEFYLPESLEYSIYGTTRTITFNEIQSNTDNIDLAKTKVSLNPSHLIQSDEVIDKIKSNILNDYKEGVSNANVTISCNDYYNEKGEKVIDWAKGEIVKLNQSIYFDNDLYADKTQRYWKIKGRTFRKTGVPMLDLELEEIKKRDLKDYSWAEINELANSGKASDFLTLGDAKKFTLTDGRELTAMIVGFNHDKKENDLKAGISFIVTDLNEQSAMGSSDGVSGLVSWSESIVRQSFLPNIYNLMTIKNLIKPVKKQSQISGGSGSEQFEETIDNLWILSKEELDGSANQPKYSYLSDNIKTIAINIENDWWLRGKWFAKIGGTIMGGTYYWGKVNNELQGTTNSTQQKNIVFGFCI